MNIDFLCLTDLGDIAHWVIFQTVYLSTSISNSILDSTVNEEKKYEIYDLFLLPVRILTAPFWINWRLFQKLLDQPDNNSKVMNVGTSIALREDVSKSDPKFPHSFTRGQPNAI